MKFRFRAQKMTFVMIVSDKRIQLICGDQQFFAEYPFLSDATGYLTDVHPQYFNLMMYVLLARIDTLVLPPPAEIPPAGRTIVSYSGGSDSTAVLHITGGIPVHINRSYNDVYEYRQMKAVAETGALVIRTDFEKIRQLYDLRHGFSIGTGYSAMFIPLLPLLKTNTIALGVIFDDVAFNYSVPFSFTFMDISKSAMYRLKETLEQYGIHIICPLAGHSEVLTTLIAAGSGIKSVTSCHTLGEDPICRKCYKCFRKQAILGNPIDWDDPEIKTLVKYILLKRPIKMASSTIYAIQQAGYKDPFFDRYRDIDVSWLKRVNGFYMGVLGGWLLPGNHLQKYPDVELIYRFVEKINEPELYKD